MLEHGGSIVEDRGDHLVLRTPGNPDFHWGNCLFVTDPRLVDDAARWIETFRSVYPTAGWLAIGLARMPDDRAAWAGRGLQLEDDDVLTTRRLPSLTPLAAGYVVRQLAGGDWEQAVARALAENERTDEYEPLSQERFARARAASQRELSERGVAAFFGAFAGEQLVADLGIVVCDRSARYQNVATDAGHRRRGLASHLLGVAARWASGRGCDRWVIVTEASNPAGRVYRRVGFEPDASSVSAYRKPER